MAKGFPPLIKRVALTVTRRSDATFDELASNFGISVNPLRRRMKQTGVADGLTA